MMSTSHVGLALLATVGPLVAGCFAPRIENGAFVCEPRDDPPCPSGFYCFNLRCVAGPARADGAFPDSMSLFLPADRPQRMVVGANFGLIVSDDDGASWYFVCEQAIAANVSAYQMSAP